jgi:uncharacterized membrane protein
MIGTLEGVIAAAIAFVASHILLSGAHLRPFLVERLGVTGFRIAYSAVALATLSWLISAYANAPDIELWDAGAAGRAVTLAATTFAAVLVACGATTRSPTGVGGEALPEAPEPAPGILKVTRHPILWGMALWALGHIPPNGDAASLIFFAALAGLAFAGMAGIDRRREEQMGAAWGPIAMTTSTLPFAALIARRATLRFEEIGYWRPILGVALYAALVALHGPVIGVALVTF